ncbi:SCO family protein [Fredinandcohnia sp. QZ13]|uniref:SCO family protein n=1 Tax=Fredinandcohnia sp. QZ13 TaxID=3073144 RepID=UPI0028533F3E|nr:SCO family protein [Fredinandcohnia sp. QZ13]MDR4887052.1 SCO family protein [Fredinandcohnia sp. QZ13]
MLRKSVGILFALVAGLTLLWVSTDGLQAFTAEKARIIELEREQPKLPSATLIDSDSETFHLRELEGKYILMTFMYTSCGDVCPVLEQNFAEIYENIPKEVLGKEVVLVSISFDPENDSPSVLKSYSNHFGADGEQWKMATIQDEQELQDVLKTLEVIVIPNEYGGYEHNSAFYVINPDGKLTNIFDYQTPQTVVEYLDTFLF